MSETVVRIAARGDGVTASGRHVPFGVPGDTIGPDGVLAPGPHHQVPPCRHFPECGGCQLQHADDAAYRDYLRSRVQFALAQHGIETEIREAHLSPPRSRRRATLRGLKVGQRAVFGLNAAKSHQIVDMRECHILRPELFEMVDPLRHLLAQLLDRNRPAEVQLTLADQGPDVSIKGVEASSLATIEQLTSFSKRHRLARLSLDQGLGPEPFYEPEPATISLSGRSVGLPIGAFLQATADGEAALIAGVQEATSSSEIVADLFAGLGTFALSLPGKIFAAEASRDAVLALKAAAPDVFADHRDLYRRPLDQAELNRFDAVILDPPRAGAEQQVRSIAQSTVPRVAYVSCNPSTFASDAKMLSEGGYRLSWVRPVGQFRWSTHVELVSAFAR